MSVDLIFIYLTGIDTVRVWELCAGENIATNAFHHSWQLQRGLRKNISNVKFQHQIFFCIFIEANLFWDDSKITH